MATFVKFVDRDSGSWRPNFQRRFVACLRAERARPFDGASFSKTRAEASRPFSVSSAPISRAMSMNRFDSAGSSGFGFGRRGIGTAYTAADHSSNGSRSCRGSPVLGDRFWCRLARLERGCRSPFEISRRVSQALTLCADKRAIGAREVVNAETDAIVVAEVELGGIAM